MNLLQNPAWFGNYRLTSRIATGGMAEVYIGRRADGVGRLGSVVAVKRLLPHLVQDSVIVRMFLNEARITAQIDHPNVVKIIELGEVQGEPFIAMELLDGRSFAEVRQRAAENGRRVPLGITLRVLAEACRGLDAAHRAVDDSGRPLCIVHRDFTPDNIHVGVDGRVRVIDFGIAKADNIGAGTEPGTLKGKFFYMSPEMIAGKPVDHRADLFAAGVMLYEQMCGRRPFTGLNPDAVLDRIAEAKPKRPSEFDPSVPPALEMVCLTALARDPARRFDSLADFIHAIEAVGGAAELASQEELAHYIDQLFPPDDPKRETLRRALQADPSMPGMKVPGAYVTPAGGSPIALVTPAPAGLVPKTPARAVPAPPPHMVEAQAEPEPEPEAPAAPLPDVAPARRRGTPIPRPAEAAPVAEADASASPAPTRARLGWKVPAIAVGALLLVGGGIAAVRLLRGPDLSPAERIAAAKAAEPAARASLLGGLVQDPRTTPEQLAQAGDLLAEAEPQQALAIAEALEARAKDSPAGYLLEARASIVQRVGKRAEAALQRAMKLAPADDARAELLLADLREKQGDLSGALDALAQANKKQPGSPELLLRQGNLLSQAERLDDAAEVLSKLARKDVADAIAELGYVRFRQENTKDALRLLKKAVEREPKLFKAHYYLGAVLFRQGDVDGAKRAYRDADALAPADPRALAALCQLQAKSGDAAGAEETRKALRERFPKQAAALTAECTP